MKTPYAIHILTTEMYSWEEVVNSLEKQMLKNPDSTTGNCLKQAQDTVMELKVAIDKLK